MYLFLTIRTKECLIKQQESPNFEQEDKCCGWFCLTVPYLTPAFPYYKVLSSDKLKTSEMQWKQVGFFKTNL